MNNTTVTIYLHEGRLSIGWDNADWTGDYPATGAGLEDLKLDLKNDRLACADDYDAIDGLVLPENDDLTPQKITLTGDEA